MRKSRLIEEIHQTAQGLHKAGTLSTQTMREFDAMCLPKLKEYSPRQIEKLRKEHKVSQAVFAAYLNTSKSTVQKWEQGQKKPSGLALRLLNLVDKFGLSLLAA